MLSRRYFPRPGRRRRSCRGVRRQRRRRQRRRHTLEAPTTTRELTDARACGRCRPTSTCPRRRSASRSRCSPRRATRRRARPRVAVAPDGDDTDRVRRHDAARGRAARTARRSTSPIVVRPRRHLGRPRGTRRREAAVRVPGEGQGRRADDRRRARRRTRHRRPPTPLGVDPICTREPDVRLHTESLDTLDRQGHAGRGAVRDTGPLHVAVLRTGARQPAAARRRLPDQRRRSSTSTSSRTCARNETSPTVTAWGLPSEPWLFGVDAAGVITARLDGAFGQDEMRAVLDSLASPPIDESGRTRNDPRRSGGRDLVRSVVTRTTGRSRRCAARSGSRW